MPRHIATLLAAAAVLAACGKAPTPAPKATPSPAPAAASAPAPAAAPGAKATPVPTSTPRAQLPASDAPFHAERYLKSKERMDKRQDRIYQVMLEP